MSQVFHTISLHARMDIASVSELHEAWLIECEKGTHLLLNCEHAEFVSAAAAQLIIALSYMQKHSGHSVSLTNLSPALIADMTLLGLSDFTQKHIQEQPHHG